MQGAFNSSSKLLLEYAFPLPAVVVQQARFESTAKEWMSSHATTRTTPAWDGRIQVKRRPFQHSLGIQLPQKLAPLLTLNISAPNLIWSALQLTGDRRVVLPVSPPSAR